MKLLTLLIVPLSTLLFACSNDSTQAAEAPIFEAQSIQKTWSLASIDNTTITAKSNLSIDAEFKATGNLACNNFFGAVAVQENKVRIENMGSTRKMCDEKTNDIEMSVSNTLATWSEAQVSEDTLTLVGEKHTLVYTIR